jgi:CO/xanthine dehydrogenase FAD-binding subunit
VLQTVHVPTSLKEAVDAVRGGGRPLAGGTIVMGMVNTQPLAFTEVVSLGHTGLSGIQVRDGEAVVGATTTVADLGRAEQLDFLRGVVTTFGSPPLRNLATIGGNLFVPQPAGDLAVCLLALDATAEVSGPDRGRAVPVAAVLEHGVAPDELVTEVRFAIPDPRNWFYTKAMRRQLNSAAIVSIAAVVVVEDGRVASARIALGGAGECPVRALAAERALAGKPLDRAAVEAAGEAALEDASTFDDAYASAWYRARVLPVHFRRALLGE